MMRNTQSRAPKLNSTIPAVRLQRQCTCGTHSLGSECESCTQSKRENNGSGILQRAAIDDTAPHDVPQIVYNVLRSPGQPLDEHTRDFMERRFGHDSSVRTITPRPIASGLTIDPADSPSEAAADRHADGLFGDQPSKHRFDFSGVRVHTDAQAAESAQAVNARAYTVGNNIVGGPGQFSPHTRSGQWLLGHELAHVVQQQSAPAISLQRVGLFESIARFFGGGTFSDEELRTYLDFLRNERRIEDSYDSDNKAREVVARWKSGHADFRILTVPIRILLIQEMLSGFTGNDDERAILDLLVEMPIRELDTVINAVGAAELRDNFHGQEREQLDGLLAHHESESDLLALGGERWTVQGVMAILHRHGDEHIIATILNQGYTVIRFKTVTDTWRHADGHEEVEHPNVLGNTCRVADPVFCPRRRVVRIRDNLSNETAAMVLYHEVGGHAAPGETKTHAEALQQEVDARVSTEEFAIRHGLPPMIPRYRNPDGTINRNAIEQDVLPVGSHYNPPQDRQRIKRTYTSEKEVTGWRMPPPRASRAAGG